VRFEDIRIVEIDTEASRPVGTGERQLVVLRLSGTPTPQWKEMFGDAWKLHSYRRKRDVHFLLATLEMISSVEDVVAHHLPELRKVIAATNEAYRRYLEEDRMLHGRSRDVSGSADAPLPTRPKPMPR
jgi:hypothetical protein